ncbi:MAG TPA: dTDP-4-dehydrorhamnose reductase [Candidatus Nanoarchaeia archaeon]|nr:dTDP-4-dehydrorhamnose reductase [Candidatus Nanoarchaeia archaeon]
MKLLITGASGLYGSKLAELALGNFHEVYSIHNQHPAAYGKPIRVDISNKNKLTEEFLRCKPDAVIHAASMTDVDKCEQNRELAYEINVAGTKNVVDAAKVCRAFLLYVSTDYVFDGEKGFYTETDLPSPISYYGYTKLKAEEYVQKKSDEFCIARPSVIYGATPAAGKINFALWLLNKLKNKEQANVFVDQWNSPTLNSSLAEMTLEVVEKRLRGIYHLSGANRITRFDFAQQLAKVFGLDASCLIPSSMKTFVAPAKRPKDSSLNTAKAELELTRKPVGIEEALARMKKEMANSI